MPTSIHAAGPQGERSPGLDAAIAGYLAENGGGGGVELVSGVVDLDGTGSPVREFYCTASATIEGVAFAAGTAVVFRRTPAGVWGYIVVDPWTDISGGTTTTTTTAATTTTTTTVNLAPSMTLGAETIDGLEVSQPFTTSDPNSDPVTVTANWDDGGSPEVVTSPAVHTYAASGTYDATFTPNDGLVDGAVRFATYTVSGWTLPPVGDPATLEAAMIAYGSVGYWKLNENSGTTITDYSGLNRHGTLMAANHSTDYTLAGQDGYLKWNVSNATTTIDVPSASDFSIQNGNNGGITVFACFRKEDGNATRHLVTKGVAPTNSEWLLTTGPDTVQGRTTVPSGTFIAQSSLSAVRGVWHGVACTLPVPGGSAVPQPFVDNGTIVSPNTDVQAGTNVANSGKLTIGQLFLGAIGHVAIFPHILTPEHIGKLMTLARAEGIIP